MTRAQLTAILRAAAMGAVPTVAASIWCAGCGTSSPPPTPSVASSSARSHEAHEADDPNEAFEPEPAIPTASDAELDAMARGELELLCEQGSTAACDRLGH